MKKLLLCAALPFILLACGSESTESTTGGNTGTETIKTDDQYRQEAITGTHDLILTDLNTMIEGAKELQAAAPTPPDRGWDTTLDADSIAKMKDSWIKVRDAYERSEGAIAPIFPNIDFALDGRYDDFMTKLAGQNGDDYLFDGMGVTGMHAIERILYSNTTPAYVVDFEKTLPGYKAAAFPATAMEASDFKAKLCQKFIDDATDMQMQWTPANVDIAIAFQGLKSLVLEQREKVQKAASSEEESRYSQRTMQDLRNNLKGTRAAYAFFQPWLLSKSDPSNPDKDGKAIDAKILKGFDELQTAYDAVSGPAIPQPPPTWSSVNPTAEDLMTPFGKLFTAVKTSVDESVDDSIAAQMHYAATLLGFPEF